MVLAKVIGTVVATRKAENIGGIKFLLLEKIDPISLKGKNDFVIAMDSVGAGEGEIVFYASGSSARFTKTTEGKSTDSTVVAIVELIEKDGILTYKK
ncbi:MAG TPA: EutN/CcmL family microcompartment protein [Bacteroidales bacterium]|nr:EutN/CcmL family microcompartment protein [Bacteroidales bacterium]